ncbi:MAG TPA: hypothetical protein VKY59_12175, partial [Spirillospora sp.]|nr:hypothetical protein [Spirillospora sp.]
DQMISGERRGIGYAALNVVGALLAGLFILYNFLLSALDKLASINPEAVEELAIEPTDRE